MFYSGVNTRGFRDCELAVLVFSKLAKFAKISTLINHSRINLKW